MSRDILASEPAKQAPLAGRPGRVGTILLEGMLVIVTGLVFAFLANAISPRGLKLAQNYFPGGHSHARPASNLSATESGEAIATRLHEKGLQPIERAAVEQLLRDPRYAQGLIVFVDARSDLAFQTGHIPGAYPFDRFRPQNHMATVLPACLVAERVVIYCSGGDCEDSEFAAILLRESGVTNEKLFIYVGGIKDWEAAGLPVELGERNSGQLREAAR